jgi:hypothetical protein
MQRLKSVGPARRFRSTHAAVFNIVNFQRRLATTYTHRARHGAAIRTPLEATAA